MTEIPQCDNCRFWTIDPLCKGYSKDNQWGTCKRQGPGLIYSDGKVELVTDRQEFCSSHEERTHSN